MTKLDQNNIRGTLTAPFETGSYGYNLYPPTPVVTKDSVKTYLKRRQKRNQ